MLEKVDGFIKGFKRYTTSGIYIMVAAYLAKFGHDLDFYVQNIEIIWASLFGSYTAIMNFLKAISKDG